MTRRAWRDRELERGVGPLAAALARSVRAGATLQGAIEEVRGHLGDPLDAELDRVVAAVRGGASLDRSLDAWRRSRGLPALDLLVAGALLARRDGGDLAAALETAAVAATDRVELADEARTLATQARTSAAVMAALPVVGLTCFAALDPSVLGVLVGSGAGRVCLVVGTALQVAGAFALAQLTKRALS